MGCSRDQHSLVVQLLKDLGSYKDLWRNGAKWSLVLGQNSEVRVLVPGEK